MTKITAPRHQNGKIILQYRGTNLELRNKPSLIQICELKLYGTQLIEHLKIYETLTIGFTIPDNFEVILSFKTKQINWKAIGIEKKFWITDERGKIIENEILLVENNILLIGKFISTKVINMADVRSEEYNYTAIFENRGSLYEDLADIGTELNYK